LKTLKFPKEYDLKVDVNKVNWEVIKGWVAKRITELLGVEDEVLIGYVFEQLENKAVSSSYVLRNLCLGPLPCEHYRQGA
jgi:serine/arginine repetitive matrix protein 1